jgi:hypothetical protein
MIFRVDTRGGVHTSHISVTSVTSVTRPVYAGCRGAKKNRSVTKVLRQVLHKPLPKQTAPLKKEKHGVNRITRYTIYITTGVH